MPSVPERVELIIGHDQGGLSLRDVLTLGQLVAAEAPAVKEIEGIASRIRDLRNEMQRNRDERAHLGELLSEKLASVLRDPCRYMREGGNHGEANEVPPV